MNIAKMHHHHRVHTSHWKAPALDVLQGWGQSDEAASGAFHDPETALPWSERRLQNDNTTKIVKNQTWLMAHAWLEVSHLKTKHLPRRRSHPQTSPPHPPPPPPCPLLQAAAGGERRGHLEV